MKIQLKITKGNKSGLFNIAPKFDEIFQAGEWSGFAYPSLEDSKDYVSIDLITGYEGSFNVIEYGYAEGNCVKDTVEAEDVDFSYSFLVNGLEASYSEVYEALNGTQDDENINYVAHEEDGFWFVHFYEGKECVWTEQHDTLEEVKTVYAGLDLEIAS
jgi:hypothetical protein